MKDFKSNLHIIATFNTIVEKTVTVHSENSLENDVFSYYHIAIAK